MDNEIDTLSLDHFRQRSPRQRKRAQRRDREKSLMRLYREYDALRSQLHRLGYERLDPPVQRGWKRFFVLRDHPMQRITHSPRREESFFQGILDKISTTQYSSKRDFKMKRRRRGRKIHEPRPQELQTFWTKTFKAAKFTEEEARYFDLIMTNEREGSYYRWMYVFREPWRFRLKVEPNIIRWKRVKDFDLERRIAEMKRYIDGNHLWPQIFRVLDGSHRWRGAYWSTGELAKYKDPFKNKAFADILDQYMPDRRANVVNMKPSDIEGFLFTVQNDTPIRIKVNTLRSQICTECSIWAWPHY